MSSSELAVVSPRPDRACCRALHIFGVLLCESQLTSQPFITRRYAYDCESSFRRLALRCGQPSELRPPRSPAARPPCSLALALRAAAACRRRHWLPPPRLPRAAPFGPRHPSRCPPAGNDGDGIASGCSALALWRHLPHARPQKSCAGAPGRHQRLAVPLAAAWPGGRPGARGAAGNGPGCGAGAAGAGHHRLPLLSARHPREDWGGWRGGVEGWCAVGCGGVRWGGERRCFGQACESWLGLLSSMAAQSAAPHTCLASIAQHAL